MEGSRRWPSASESTERGEAHMRVRLRAFAALAAAVLLIVPGALASGAGSANSGFDSATGAWFVELSGSAQNFNTKAKGEGLQYTERFRFTKLWKGVSVNASGDTAQLMRKLDGVVSVHPVGVVSLPPTEQVSEPELIHALAMTGADVAQNELGLDGSGIQVGVMDTGIDGANGTVNGTEVKGVAPGVTFGAYRVFGCAGSTTEDIMVAAMERAQADGMDIVNMSIGDAFAWDTEPFAQAMNAAVAEGTVVVISAGNSGTNGLYSLSSAGNARDVIGVASIDNSHVELTTFTVTPANLTAGYTNASGTQEAPTTGSLPMAKTGTPAATADGCAPQDLGDLTGKAVLIERGTCTFYEKARRAQLAGAAAVVLYNNVPGRFGATVAVQPGAVTDRQPVTIPVVAISDTEGAAINNAIAGGSQTLNWTDDSGVFANATAGQPSSFTSWGLAPSLGFKPDIAAPGGLIKSTWPMEQGGFATISGTSMAAPHVSGAAALFLEEHGTTNPLTLREILQNNAVPSNLPPPNTSFVTSAHRQGAGTLQIDDAILATTRVSPGKLALGEGTTGQTRTLTLHNGGTSAVTYDLSHQAAPGTSANTFAPGQTTNFATVGFSAASVAVPAGGSATVDVTITPNAAAANDRRIYSGYIRLTPQGGGAPLRVPYAGFTGDYQSIVVLAPGACTFPGIFKAGGSTTCAAGPPAVNLNGWTRQAAGATFNVGERSDRPVVLYHLAHQSQRVELRAVNASDQEFFLARTDFAERNPTNDLTPPGQTSGPGFFTFTWDGKHVVTKKGKTKSQALPNGTYRLRLVVTKANAEAGNPAHTETFTSPTMN